MQDGDRGFQGTPENDEPSQSSTSYIYPVKSLLTGIQPAPPTQSRPSVPRRNSAQSGGLAALQDLLTHQLAGTRKKSVDGSDGLSPHSTSSRSHSIFYPCPSRTAMAGPSDPPEDQPSNASDPSSSRTQPIERRSSFPISFAEATLPSVPIHPPFSASPSSLSPPQLDLSIPNDPPQNTRPAPPRPSQDGSFAPHKSGLPQKLAEHSLNEENRASPTHSDTSHVSHISRSGIVHLPPLSSASASSRAGSRGSGSHTHSSSRKYFASSNSNASSQRMGQVPESQEADKPDDGSGPPSSHLKSVDSGAAGDLRATSYRHETDENGNHLVIGREGDIRRCEDEPISTPGAVQGFGVMLVVAEDVCAETLTVRQASENSTDVLGLSPRYLFDLECFTDVLPDSQADILWDSVQFVGTDWTSEDEPDHTPHIITITGWGQPGSDDASDDDQRRKRWKAWCAIHRPKMPDNPDRLPLVILEFELENDDLSPLCPPRPETSPLGSPASGSTGSMATGASLDGLRTESDLTIRSAGGTMTPPDIHRLDGDDEWQPSPQDVLESTTSRSKPLKALQRLRKFEASCNPTSGRSTVDSNASPSPVRRNGRARRSVPADNVNVMDVFAVMSQINEQFGNAQDLETFLNVVVGVIKELTQFHRVLVYQFDEVWNGFVTAELVDWSKTRDLYKGLHFPASDIPPQARELYVLNKVRLLYDRDQPTARLVVKSRDDIDPPLDMTHCFLRAMSPIHLKC